MLKLQKIFEFDDWEQYRNHYNLWVKFWGLPVEEMPMWLMHKEGPKIEIKTNDFITKEELDEFAKFVIEHKNFVNEPQ
jgi:hypothetical protein